MHSLSTVLQLKKNDEVCVVQKSGGKLRFAYFVGYLLNPNVSFCAKGTRKGTTAEIKPGQITYGSVSPNHGNGLVTSTGIFTAPVSGTYAFHFHALHWYQSKVSNISFRLNNHQVAGTYIKESVTPSGRLYQMVAISVVLKLEENDVVDIFLSRGKLHCCSLYLSLKGYLLF